MLKVLVMKLATKLGLIKVEKLKEQELKDLNNKFCSMIQEQLDKAATVKLSDYDYINK